jgi:hypothetical protein
MIRIAECDQHENMFMLTAFFDARAWHWYSEAVITTIMVVHKNSTNRHACCMVNLASGQSIVTTGKLIELPESHDTLYRPSYVHCNLTEYWEGEIPFMEKLKQLKTVSVSLEGAFIIPPLCPLKLYVGRMLLPIVLSELPVLSGVASVFVCLPSEETFMQTPFWTGWLTTPR